jgi:GNAT superfamily N-acetyltransferase
VNARIRRAQAVDAEDLMTLINAHAGFENGTATLSQEQLGSLLRCSDPPCRLWVAEMECLVGYAALTLDYALWSGSWFGHVDCLFVMPDHRGHQTGEKLFAVVADAARRLGAVRLEWQTPHWNDGAIRFYHRQGATGLDKRRFRLDLPPG